MQTEQQTTPQTKKSTSETKKGKKTSKSTEQTPVQTLESVPETVNTEVKVTLQEVVPVTQSQSETETVVVENSAVVEKPDFNTIIDYLNESSDTLTEYSKYFKDNTVSKEERSKVESAFKKFSKASTTVQLSYTDYLSRQVSSFEKSSGNKSNGVKKVADKEKSAIHKKLNVQPFLLKFMKLEPGTHVSRSDALTAITGFVKNEKVANPDIIVENDKRSFKLIGELKTLFGGIEQVMKSKNLLNDKQMPSEIKYTQIMQYMTHCFIKPEEANVV